MEFSQSTRIVFDRIQTLEPEFVSKIIGYLLLQDYGEREMVQLAFGPNSLIHSLINKAKSELGLLQLPISTQVPPSSISPPSNAELSLQFTPFSPLASRPFSSPPTFRASAASPYWDAQLLTDQPPMLNNIDLVSPALTNSIEDDYRLHSQAQFLNLDDQLDPANAVGAEFPGSYFYPDSPFSGLPNRTSRRSPSLPDFPLKTCHYFNKGFCKHGANCRYIHGHGFLDGFSQIFVPTSAEFNGEDYLLSPGSLEKLELEIAELLKVRRGMPVSIASLPMLYYEKYGKTLQAEGYLTESQRNGKAGYSLTKLLARLNNSIRVIDRPHGQHSVILAEDAPKFMEYRNERSDPGAVVAGSRQIYLTFPAESTFTEEDVSNYFNGFGPVQDVRIPCQQKRMFGFVTFLYPETVKLILTKGNPHFVCGARVLVKPYKEKSKLVDRKSTEKIEPPVYLPSHFLDMDPELHLMPRVSDNSRLLRKQLIEEQEHALELERRRLSEFQLTPKTLPPSYFINPMDVLKFSEDQNEFASVERYSFLSDILNNSSANDDKVRNISSNYSEQESNQGINLPESPFASPIAS